VPLRTEQDSKEKTPQRFKFRRYNRIHKTSDFKYVAQHGKKINDRFLVINYLERGDNKATRLGIITTRRLGKATQRNRLRRVLREAFRHVLPKLRRGFDIVVIVREKARETDCKVVRESFHTLLIKAGILQHAHA